VDWNEPPNWSPANGASSKFDRRGAFWAAAGPHTKRQLAVPTSTRVVRIEGTEGSCKCLHDPRSPPGEQQTKPVATDFPASARVEREARMSRVFVAAILLGAVGCGSEQPQGPPPR